MRIVILSPDAEAREPAVFAAALRSLGHSVATSTVADVDPVIDPSQAAAADLIFLNWFTHVPPLTACLLSRAGVRVAIPPLHTIALLDHPTYWRMVLEREGVPVNPWLHVGSEMEVSRDSRVSVLGFPLRVSRAQPGVPERTIAADRDALFEVGAALRNPRGLIVERYPQGDEVSAFTGFTDDPSLDAALDDGRAGLTLALARHMEGVLELAGPWRLDMIWERGRLLLLCVAPVEDLRPESQAFRAVGGEYESFVRNLVQAAMRTAR